MAVVWHPLLLSNRPWSAGLLTFPMPHQKHNVAPGSCDIANYAGLSEGDCNIRCYSSPDCLAYVMSYADNRCYLKSCSSPVRPDFQTTDAYIITGPKPSCNTGTTAQQRAVTVHPTRTVFELNVAAGKVAVNVTFLSTMFTDDFLRLSRPVYYIDFDIAAQDGQTHDVQVHGSMQVFSCFPPFHSPGSSLQGSSAPSPCLQLSLTSPEVVITLTLPSSVPHITCLYDYNFLRSTSLYT